MRNLLAALFVLLCLIAAVLGFMYGPRIQQAIKAKEAPLPSQDIQKADIKKVQALLQEGKSKEAMDILRDYQPYITQQTELGKIWLGLLIETATQQQNIPQMLTVYEYFPSSIDDNENAALLVEKGFLTQGRSKEFEILREKWKNKEKLPDSWFIIDADKLILEGKRDQALTLLNSKTLPGKEDTNRLMRLALVYVMTNPEKAWGYLSEALKKDPDNPSIRLYRARMLEAVDKPDLALSEYFAAVQVDQKNLNIRSQLADFFQRYHQYNDALQVWEASLKPPSEDSFWAKAWFWSQVYKPIKFDWNSTPIPDGNIKPFIEYLIALPKGTYWDDAAFDKIPHAKNFLSIEQETLWLRVIQAIKDGNEAHAGELLQFDPFKNTSWYPALSQALQQVINFRKTGSLDINANKTGIASDTTTPIKKNQISNDFFKTLNEAVTKKDPQTGKPALPPGYADLLTGKEAFSAVFLAAGWNEIALRLHQLPIIPDNYPDWISFNLTQALSQNRTLQDALDFATKQKQTPTMTLLIGELLVTSGNVDAGVNKLKTLSEGTDDTARRAAWIIALVYLDNNEIDKAKDWLKAHKTLADDVTGKEISARIALVEKNPQQAEAIYSTIENSSAEAKSYLARQAFDQKNFKRAQELTESLLLQYPNNIFIRVNLQKIYDAEKADKE